MYKTGHHIVDSFHYEIRGRGRTVKIEPRVMRLLVYFLERPGEVISKQTLLREVWQGTFVSDDVVATAVYQVRKAFRDDASRPRFLETVHRRGYRWCAPVTSAPSRPNSSRRSRLWIAAALGAIAIIGSIAILVTPRLPSAKARAAYAKGRFFIDQRTTQSLVRARDSFRAALRAEPNWSAAHAGLADVAMLEVDLGLDRSAEVRARARRLAERALELDRTSSAAWVSIALVRLLLDFDFDSANRAFVRALELDPTNAFAHQTFAWHLSARGRLDEAIDHTREAVLVAPTHASPHLDLAFILGFLGRHDEAVREVEAAIELDGRRASSYAALGWAHVLGGREQEGLSAFHRVAELSGGLTSDMMRFEPSHDLKSYFRNTLETQGMRMGWTAKARLHALLGESDDAIECLENAYRERDTGVLWVPPDPVFADLQHDARFQDLLSHLL